jgi:iron complex outermembrane receptor protein
VIADIINASSTLPYQTAPAWEDVAAARRGGRSAEPFFGGLEILMSRRLPVCSGSRPAFVMVCPLFAHANGFAQTVEDLRNLPIEDLAAIKVSSVSKTPQRLSDAPAAIYVISHDDIIQSGATTLPDMLRLAPNLEVVQLNANSYAISARGFNVGDNAALSNKLLVLIDGRSVYTPLFGGVYRDMLQILPDDIERIEVISGPGATLWGANAVNGVINIITRPFRQTQGGTLTVGGGNIEQMASLQYGVTLSPDLSFRVNAAGYNFASLKDANGQKAEDGLDKPAGGARIDWTPGSDILTAEGDLFAAEEGETGYLTRRDVSFSWQHPFDDGGQLQLLAYYDREGRYDNGGGPGFSISTYDVEAQYNRQLGSWNELVFGTGERRCPHLQVLFTSGYTCDALIRGGRLDEQVMLLSKPYTYAELASKIGDLLRKNES